MEHPNAQNRQDTQAPKHQQPLLHKDNEITPELGNPLQSNTLMKRSQGFKAFMDLSDLSQKPSP
jgi:hypothetical protein